MGYLGRLKESVMQRSREAKLADFYSYCPAECNVLDVGVSNNDHSPQVNLFLKAFRYSDRRYTGLAVESMDAVARQHPGKRFVLYDGNIFPFRDREFDFVFSNAVIEHVGGEEAQLRFINEMLRTGKRVFFTTPSKFFPVESHTNALFIHWWPRYFHSWCRRNSPYWTETNLRLLSHSDLQGMMARSDAKSFTIKRNRTLGLTMTFTVVCQN